MSPGRARCLQVVQDVTKGRPLASGEVAGRLGIRAKQASKLLVELRDLGYAATGAGGKYRLSGLVSPRVVLSEWTGEPDSPDARDPADGPSPSAAAARCRKLMPRAKAYCVLAAGHSGGCRSR